MGCKVGYVIMIDYYDEGDPFWKPPQDFYIVRGNLELPEWARFNKSINFWIEYV